MWFLASVACEGITCENGGSCSLGTCSCPTGYTGSSCQSNVETEITLWLTELFQAVSE